MTTAKSLRSFSTLQTFSKHIFQFYDDKYCLFIALFFLFMSLFLLLFCNSRTSAENIWLNFADARFSTVLKLRRCTPCFHRSQCADSTTRATSGCTEGRRVGGFGSWSFGGGGLSGGVRCWLRSLKTALKALCFQLKHPSRITHTKTYLQPAKSGACYLQRAYKSHLAASGYGISLTHTHTH